MKTRIVLQRNIQFNTEYGIYIIMGKLIQEGEIEK